MIEASDPESIRRLAVSIIENALTFATSTAAGVSAHDREDARAFLLDPADPRLDRWCAVLDLDPDALRDGLRARLREVQGDAT